MEINRTVDHLGRTTDIVTLTKEENAVIDTALETIFSRYLDAGNLLSQSDREFTEWSLLGMLRENGVETVEKYANEYRTKGPNIISKNSA